MEGKSLFVMIDGLDGSGKGVAMKGLKEWAEQKKFRVLDMEEYWKKNFDYPSEEELDNFDVIFTFEPTGAITGRKIRDKLIKKGSKATPSEIADAFAEDRKQHYEKLVIPALKKEKIIIQDRGVISSLAYQSLMDEKQTVDYLVNLEGNWIALEHSPNIIIITDVNPIVAQERLGERRKKDNVMFEDLKFQKKLNHNYKGEELKELFEERETKLVFLDTNPPKTPEDTKKGVIKIVEDFLLESA